MITLENKLDILDIKSTVHGRYVQSLMTFINTELKLNLHQDIHEFTKYHDIGKVFMLDLITAKRRLTPAEFKEIKMHPVYGAGILREYSKIGYNIAKYHHENFDGSGYPEGLEGFNIPLEAQVCKIVDVYEALRSKRPYKENMSHKAVIDLMYKGDFIIDPSHFNIDIMYDFLNNKYLDEFYNNIN